MLSFISLNGGETMVETNGLRGLIFAKFASYASFAKEVNMNPATLSKKLNNKSEFKFDEIVRICEVLEIPCDMVCHYFYKHET